MKITRLQDKLQTFSPPIPLKENVEWDMKILNNPCFVRLQDCKWFIIMLGIFFTTLGFETLF